MKHLILTLLLVAIVVVAAVAFWGFAADCTTQDGPVEVGAEAVEEIVEATSADEVVEEATEEAQAVCHEVCELAFGPDGNFEDETAYTQCLYLCRD